MCVVSAISLRQSAIEAVLLFTLAGALASNQPNTQRTTAVDQRQLYRQCIEAAEDAERVAVSMLPGRTWTWQLDAARSREYLGRLHDDLENLSGAESAFQASLTANQKWHFHTQLQSINALLAHVFRDVQSLDQELQKGYPTRWHVEHDVSDMRREIHHLKKLQRQLATADRSLASSISMRDTSPGQNAITLNACLLSTQIPMEAQYGGMPFLPDSSRRSAFKESLRG